VRLPQPRARALGAVCLDRAGPRQDGQAIARVCWQNSRIAASAAADCASAAEAASAAPGASIAVGVRCALPATRLLPPARPGLASALGAGSLACACSSACVYLRIALRASCSVGARLACARLRRRTVELIAACTCACAESTLRCRRAAARASVLESRGASSPVSVNSAAAERARANDSRALSISVRQSPSCNIRSRTARRAAGCRSGLSTSKRGPTASTRACARTERLLFSASCCAAIARSRASRCRKM